MEIKFILNFSLPFIFHEWAYPSKAVTEIDKIGK